MLAGFEDAAANRKLRAIVRASKPEVFTAAFEAYEGGVEERLTLGLLKLDYAFRQFPS